MDYTEEQMQEAIQAVRKGTSVRKAAFTYQVKREALRKRCRNVEMKKPCGQPVLTENEEALLCSYVVQLAEWGFPITTFDLRLLVRSYLRRQGRTIKKFSDGCTPGVEWANILSEIYRFQFMLKTNFNVTILSILALYNG